MNGPKKVREWSDFIHKIRRFLVSGGYHEVMTDHVVPAGAFESCIDTLKVSYRGGTGELHTSPEIEMKRLLAESSLPIYQVCRSFRDDPPTGIHLREFTMLEFYRPDVDYRSTMVETKALFEALAGKKLPFLETTVAEIVRQVTGIDLQKESTTTRLGDAVQRGNVVNLSPRDEWDDIYFKLMIEKVEPALDPHRPTLLKDYPPSQAALAGVGAGGTAERFEIYWHGMELCNGCTELTDLSELRRRTEIEGQARRARGLEAHPLPDRLLAALEKGLPPCSGVAIGLERLFLALERSV